MLKHLRKHWFWYIVNAIAIFPLVWLVWDFYTNNLSVNPIKDITLRTGQPAILVLFASLACTPLASIFGFRLANTVRKSLGLQSFMYVSLHFLTFVGLDYGFSLQFILQDGVQNKPYVLVGLAAFLILLPLAITSTQGWQKRLGRNWKRLHRLVYAAGVLGAIHFFWLARASDVRPLVYASILTLLLIVRIASVRSRLVGLRQQWFGTPKPANSTKRAANPRTKAAATPVREQVEG